MHVLHVLMMRAWRRTSSGPCHAKPFRTSSVARNLTRSGALQMRNCCTSARFKCRIEISGRGSRWPSARLECHRELYAGALLLLWLMPVREIVGTYGSITRDGSKNGTLCAYGCRDFHTLRACMACPCIISLESVVYNTSPT